jgi:phospholipase C
VNAAFATARRLLPIVVICAAATACTTTNNPFPGKPQQAIGGVKTRANQPIQHVVIIVQENRSFNNLFHGYPGATTATYGYDSKGQKITLGSIGLEANWDLEHDSSGYFAACNGQGSTPGTNCQMNGFDRETIQCGQSGKPPCPIKHPQYAFVPQSETKPYFAMAKQYVLAYQMYASNFDASSFVSHQYIITGQAESAVDYPVEPIWGCPGGPSDTVKEVGPQRQIPSGSEVVCWDPTTLGDELDKAGTSWAYYAWTYQGYPFLWNA